MIQRITPKEGLQVRKPSGDVLDPAGEDLEKTSYWVRREKDGDVTITARQDGAAEKKGVKK